MESLWIVQMVLNLMLLAAFVLLWWDRRELKQSLSRASGLDEALNQKRCEMQAFLDEARLNLSDSLEKWEERLQASKDAMADQRTSLRRLASASKEAKEIEVALNAKPSPAPSAKIPLLKELELTQNRIRSEITVGLKTLLRDQIS